MTKRAPRRRAPRRPRASVPASHTPLPVTAPPSAAAPVLNAWPTYAAFAYLLLAGTLLAFFKTLTLTIAAIVFALIALNRVERRFPQTARLMCAFLSGLLGGGRRRGRW
jgi:hypothetical protein